MRLDARNVEENPKLWWSIKRMFQDWGDYQWCQMLLRVQARTERWNIATMDDLGESCFHKKMKTEMRLAWVKGQVGEESEDN